MLYFIYLSEREEFFMLAHITEDNRKQTLKQHCRTVSALCVLWAKPLCLAAFSELIGLLHDFGKAVEAFQRYLAGGNEHPNHSAAGAIYAYKRWFQSGNAEEKIVAQIIALCVCGHHSGLHDCLRKDGTSPFLKYMDQEECLFYEEAKETFLREVASEAELDDLFHKACQEFRQLPEKMRKTSFFVGMLTRLLFSMLIDADRWDSACFEYRKDPWEQAASPDWDGLNRRLSMYCEEHFTGSDRLSAIRRTISDTCGEKAASSHGIFRLSVPTGGGKTLSSLRFALLHAGINHQQRIFYIIPFNTILDQNAKDIREALQEYPSILEHHSNVVIEDEKGEEQQRHQQLTERWDSDIILTSMVQFLNACYSGKNSDARRLHRLTNAVLIFDEVQALPQHCKTLFERAICFLSEFCGSTVVLCTATQPELDVKPTEIMENVTALYQDLKRVDYYPQLMPLKGVMDAAEALTELVCRKQAVLMVTNTKAAAWNIFDNARQLLMDHGYQPVSTPLGLSDDEIRALARSSTEKELLCVHLSTLMCAAHRLELLRWVRIWTKEQKNVLCVSTALIEAGINVSFPVVVRSLAGLPSIIQAGGRCNRNMEWKCGEVYIWRLEPDAEHLPAALEDISTGQVISQKLLHSLSDGAESLDSPNTIRRYFNNEKAKMENKANYPFEGSTLVELLEGNKRIAQTYAKNHPSKPLPRLMLRQSFRTVGEAFKVIEQTTMSVLVPYGEGQGLLTELERNISMEERFRLLRKAQRYSVNLFEDVYRRLAENGALHRIEDIDIVVLDSEYYDADGGVLTERRELEEIIF